MCVANYIEDSDLSCLSQEMQNYFKVSEPDKPRPDEIPRRVLFFRINQRRTKLSLSDALEELCGFTLLTIIQKSTHNVGLFFMFAITSPLIVFAFGIVMVVMLIFRLIRWVVELSKE